MGTIFVNDREGNSHKLDAQIGMKIMEIIPAKAINNINYIKSIISIMCIISFISAIPTL